MQILIETEILKNYPKVNIGYLLAKVCVKKSDPYVENLKSTLVQALHQQGIDKENFYANPNLAIWNICNIVDLYNCCSVLSLLPMGGYDFNKISGNITIRYAKERETFLEIGAKQPLPIHRHHIIPKVVEELAFPQCQRPAV